MIKAYFYLILSSVLLSVMSLLRKEFQRKNGSLYSILFFSVFAALIIVLCGNVVSACRGFQIYKKIDAAIIAAASIYGLVTLGSTMLCILGTKFGNVSVLVMFATLGQIVLSSVYGLMFDAENNRFSVSVIIGYMITAVIIALSFLSSKGPQDEKRRKNKKIFLFFCVALFLVNGLALPILSLFTRMRPAYSGTDFLTISSAFTFLYGGIFLLVLCVCKKKKPSSVPDVGAIEKSPERGISKYSVLLIILYAFVYFGSDLLALLCTSLIPIVIQAPLSFSISIVVLTIFDFIIYKERPSKSNMIQMILAVICNIFFAL